MSALDEIAAERRRQVEREGWAPEHDDEHEDRSLALAAALYASPISLWRRDVGSHDGLPAVTYRDPWPWFDQAPGARGGSVSEPAWDKRKQHSEQRRLVIAAALIVAEIERLDRLEDKRNAK